MPQSTPTTRRAFLARTIALGASSLAATAPITRSTSAAEEEPADEPWQIGCYTRPWDRHDYRVALDAIAAADEAGIAMVLTGVRHFRH